MISCDNTNLLMYQYQDSPRVRDLILEFTREFCSLQVACEQLETRLDVELSEGVQLDLIGEIVGAPRPRTMQASDEDTFVFDDPDGTGPWGGLGLGWSGVGRGEIGGRFVGLSGLLVGAMPDADYRVLIRARIFTNAAKGTVDDLVGFLNFAIGGQGNNVINEVVGEVTLVVGRNLSPTELAIVELMAPVAAGIRLAEVIQAPAVLPVALPFAL